MRTKLREKEEEIERKRTALNERTRAMKCAEKRRDERSNALHQAAALARNEKVNNVVGQQNTPILHHHHHHHHPNRKLDQLETSFSPLGDDEVDTTDLPSTTASMTSKRRHLEEKEAEIALRNEALEEASRLNQQRKFEIR